MARKPFTPPTPDEARRHWQGQDPSVFRQPGSHDPGMSIVPNRDAVLEVVEREAAGEAVSLYRQKSPATALPDPVAEAQRVVRRSRAKSLEEVLAEDCRTVEHMMLVNALKGAMTASQRATALKHVAEMIFRQQQEASKQHNILKREEERRAEQMLAAMRAMTRAASKGAAGGEE